MGRHKADAQPVNEAAVLLEMVKSEFRLTTDDELSELLNVPTTTIRTWRARNGISRGNLLTIYERTGIALSVLKAILKGESVSEDVETERSHELDGSLKSLEASAQQLYEAYSEIMRVIQRIRIFNQGGKA